MMAANPSVTEEEAMAMVKYILALDDAPSSIPLQGKYEFNQHVNASSSQYQFNATYQDQGANGIDPLSSSKAISLKPLRIQAEDFSDLSDGRPVDLEFKEGMGLARLRNNSFVRYNDIDLTGIGTVNVNYVTTVPVNIELREGGVEGTLVASGILTPTTSSNKDQTISFIISNQSNQLNDLYVIVKAEESFGRRLFIDWFQFEIEDQDL